MKLSHASPKSVKQVADDLGIAESLLYRWRKRYTADGDKSRYATLEDENRALRLELAELKIEQDMLKNFFSRIMTIPWRRNLHKPA